MTRKEEERNELKQQYFDEMSALLDNVDDPSKRAVINNLLDKIAYLTVMLNELQAETLKKGVVCKYNNGGGQSGYRISPSVQVYTQYSKTLNAELKTLLSYIPEESADAKDGLTSFFESHK